MPKRSILRGTIAGIAGGLFASWVMNELVSGSSEALTHEERAKGGPFVHYAFGAVAGGVYGALAEVSPIVTSGFGTSYGSVLFTGANALRIPTLQLSVPVKDTPSSPVSTPLAARIVYGLSAELVRRLVRKAL